MFTPIFIKNPNNSDLINLSFLSIIRKGSDDLGCYIKLVNGAKSNSYMTLRFDNLEERDNFYLEIKSLICNNIY